MFVEGRVYKRSGIHDQFGGNRQSGICPSAKMPYIFIFTGASGEQHGYIDSWLNDEVFSYSGEGQIGDMEFTKGNLALRNHSRIGKRVFLFEYIAKSMVRFIGEVEFMDFGYFPMHDRNGDERLGIKFFFRRLGGRNYTIPNELISKLEDSEQLYEYKKPDKTERKGLVTSRVGQGAYRKSILHRWTYKCAVTGFDNIRVLVASHIVPWKDSTDDERLDVDNGILLSPDFDALFDKHLISFERSGNILLSQEISSHPINSLGITGKEKINNLSEGNKSYLDLHSQRLT